MADLDDWVSSPDAPPADVAPHLPDDWVTPEATAKPAGPPEWKEPPPPPPELKGTPEAPYQPTSKSDYETWKATAPKGSVVTINGETWVQPENPPPPPPSAGGAAVRGAVRGAVPAVGGLAGAAAGAEVGAAAGSMLGPVGAAVGGFGGGLAGAFGGGYIAQKAQELIFKHLPPWAVEALGQLPEQQQADIAAHPIAAFAGELAPNAALFSPLAAERAAAPYAQTILQRLAQNPTVHRLVPATVMAGQEAGTEYAEGEPLSAAKIALSGAAGAAMGRPTALGERVMGYGAAPVRTLSGRGASGEASPAAVAAGAAPSGEGAAAPTNIPPVGSVIGWPMPEGVVPVTVDRVTPQGDIVLKDSEGGEHHQTPADVARLATAVPEAPNVETPPPAGAAPAAEAAAAQGVAGATRPQGAPEAPPIAQLPPEMGGPETSARSLDDLEREAAAERAAAQGRAAPPPEAATAAAEAKLAQQAQGETPAEAAEIAGGVPRGTQQPAGRAEAPAEPQAAPEIGGAPDRPQAPVAEPTEPRALEAQASRPAEPAPEEPTQAEALKAKLAQIEQLHAENMRPEGGDNFFQRQLEEAQARGAPEGSRVPVEGEHFVTASRPESERATQTLLGETFVPPPEQSPVATTGPQREPPGAPVATNGPQVTDETHTKTGKPIYAVRFPQKPDIEGLGARARQGGGYWSSFRGGGMRPGWMFKTREAADQFAEWARSKSGQAIDPAMEGAPPAATQTNADRMRQAADWKEIGLNHEGKPLFEDSRGVRSIIENGIRKTEPVGLRPTRGGMEFTTDRTERPEYQIAQPHAANPREVEYQPPRPAEDAYVPSGMDPELYRMRQEVARAQEETERDPSDAQKESGNYAKGRVDFHGIPFVMENPAGSYREGIAANGERWSVEMPVDYGYIAKTRGADDEGIVHKPEGVDAFLGHDLLSQTAYVIDQQHADTGAFDEHKVMLGFSSWPDARKAYLDAFSDDRGAERIGNVTPMSLDQLKAWLVEGDTRNPVGQQALPFGEPQSLQAGEEGATLETHPSAEEAEHGVPGGIPESDAGAGTEAAPRPAEARPGEPAPPRQDEGGIRAPPAPVVAAPEPGASGEGGGRGAGVPPVDRLPAGEERPGDVGAAIRSADAERGRGSETGRVPDASVKGENHVIAPGSVGELRSPRVKARDNIAAIELAKALVAEGRPATKEEQAILARYVGWGGLSGAFPDGHGNLRKGFEDVGARLRQILAPDEYRTAARSTQYAHYTSEPVIRSMWDAVRRMGFNGGAVFEPGMGIGHFLGMMPPDLAAASRYQGIELDGITAQIAKLLYPRSGVRKADFTRTPVPPDSFDLAIGNPPFGDISIRSDPKYAARKFLLHDYFFAKSLDSVRPGGLLAFVTSAGTMNKLDDAARRYMAERAEFVGGVRLPSTAFAKNAGTEVTADILFFKKRPFGLVDLGDETPDWAQTVQRTLPDAKGTMIAGNVNRYFSEHPEMVLGEEGFFDKLYKGRYAVHETPGTDLGERLADAFSRLPENIMEPPPSPEQMAALDFATTERKEGSFYIAPDGRLMQYSQGAGRPIARRGAGVEGGYTASEVDTIRQLLPVRDALREVFRHDLAGDTEAAAAARAALNHEYDAFVARNGPLNKAEVTRRRPSVVQQEGARSEAREEARDLGMPWDEGDFDPTDLIRRKAKLTEIARARQQARDRAIAAGREFDEGTFDPADMPDIEIIKKPNLDPFSDDQESYRLSALEDYDPTTGRAEKRRIFRESVLTREEEPQLKSPQDGILWSINKFGRLDIGAIADRLGMDHDAVVNGLGDAVMRVPGTEDTYETRDAYLSGDVVSKLADARAAAERDPRFQTNVAALDAVQPQPLSPAEIQIHLGMPWIPVETINDFVDHLKIGSTRIAYSPLLGRWTVDRGSSRYNERTAEFSTEDMSAHELLAEALNGRSPVVRRTAREPDGSTRTWVDEVATQAAQDKANQITQAFDDWMGSDPARADRLAQIYNDKFNRVVLRQWDGSYLTTPGVSKDWHWRPHQTRVVARIVQDGNTYLAHAVGAGKTSEMIGAGMEMRRLGLVHKPMYVVPNHMLGQFAKEFYEQYPTARIRVADDRNFHTSRRKQFVADVAQQDLDAVIITNSAFRKIPISREFGDKLIQEQIDEIDDALAELDKRRDRITVKDLQKRKEKLQQRLSGIGGEQDAVNTFEEIGVDFLFVDEAHQFRKLSFVTQAPMKGITSQGSDMAWDLYTKIRYLDSNRPGRSIVMASGTPVTNTMGELYTLSRYMQPEALKDRGLSHFDSWRQAFGRTKTDIEQTAQGTYESVTRFARLVNIPELYKMVGSVMDIVTPTELGQYVTRPAVAGGQRQLHLAPRSDWLLAFQQRLADRVKAIRDRRGPPTKGDDILLSVINDGRLAALDPRLIDPRLPPDPDSKLNQMIDNVHRIWQETKDTRFFDPNSGYKQETMRGPATQMVFANFGIRGDDGRFSAYQWMRRELIRRGIPAEEIAFIKDATTPIAKQRLFNDVNDGKVRILIGSTQKMGTGVNAQRRLVAIHNLDPLWYPADDEQRVGRGLRQGNFNPEIQIHDYSTKGTYDSTMWAMMGRKGRFIEQFFRGDPKLRDMEDLGEASQYEQASAMATADERVIRLTEMRQELQKIERRLQAHENEQYAFRARAARYAEEAAKEGANAAAAQEAIGRAEDIGGDNFRMTVDGRRLADRKKAAEAIEKVAEQVYPGMRALQQQEIGTIGGFPLIMEAEPAGRTQSTPQKSNVPTYRLRLWDGRDVLIDSNTGAGVIASASSIIRRLPERLSMHQAYQREAMTRAESNRSQIGKEFAEREQIAPLRQRIHELEAELSRKEAPEGTEAEAPEAGATETPEQELERLRAQQQQHIDAYLSGQPWPEDHAALMDRIDVLEKELKTGRYLEDRPGSYGLAGSDLTLSPNGAFADRLPAYRDFAAAVGEPHAAAHQWLRSVGETTGHEHLTAHDATGEATHAYTQGNPSAVDFSPDLVARLQDPSTAAVLHHNHPSGAALSAPDLRQLGFPGLQTVVAHTHDGNISAARLSPEAAMAMAAESDLNTRKNAVGEAAKAAANSVGNRLWQAIKNGLVTRQDAERLHNDLINRALDGAGVIDYMSSHSLRPLPEFWARHVIAEASRAADLGLVTPEDMNARLHRSTVAVRPEEILGGLSQGAGEPAAGRPGREAGAGAGGEDAGRGQGLAEERPDYSEDAERRIAEAVRQAVPRGTTWSEAASRILGVGDGSPGAGDHWFNAVNKDFTTPSMKAALDPRSNRKWQAELGKYRDAAERVHDYRDGLRSWEGKPAEQWRKLFAAMEILTLEGREVPLDGRAIITPNNAYPYAALSKPGDVIRLTEPDEIQMFADYRRTMDGVWNDLVSETARQFGWEGVPSSAAIRHAAEGMTDAREARRLERAAKIVAAIEYQHRTAYLPLMRQGDYFLRVKPSRPSDLWNGEGYPPTVMFKLIDSLSPVERAVGGIRQGVPRLAQDAIAELRQTFPEGEFSIDHGYMFRSADAIRDLDIPAIDKLMMLVGNDARGDLRQQFERAGEGKEAARSAAQDVYDKLVDTVLDQVYEQRVAGFKRTRQGIAGYDSDFARSTGQYLGWLANHIADLRHRPEIEAADQGIETHPDPRTRAFWRDWDRRQEDYGDQLHGPLAKLRQGAFMWLLGANAATTAKIMLHGPLRAMPILTTGLGTSGRSLAAGSYLNASRQLLGALTVGPHGIAVDFDRIAGSLSPAERALIADSERKGILHPQTADEMAAIRNQGEDALTERGRFLRRVFDIWTSNVSAADRLVRGAILLAGYRTAAREGMDAINRVWDRNLNWRNAAAKTPETFGQFLVDHTVGIWGDINRMPALRSQVGGLIGQFRTYEIGYLSNLQNMMTRMGPEGRVTAALMLGGLGMLGGVTALPFIDDAEKAGEWAYKQIIGMAPDLQADLRDAMDSLMGKGTGNIFVHGARPGGVDWSGIGFGDLISRGARSPMDLFGAALSTFTAAPMRAYQRYQTGQGAPAAGAELLPNAVRHWLDAMYPEIAAYSASGKSKIESQMSDADRLRMGLGFQTATRAEKFDKIGEASRLRSNYTNAVALAENKAANLFDRGDQAGARQAIQEAMGVIAAGQRAGIFTPQEIDRYQRELRGKIAQRMNPALPSRMQQRIEAARQAVP